MPLEVLTPKAGKGPGVLVVHPWWGLNRTTRGYGAALAAEGFVVGLADLFEGETASTIEEATTIRDRTRKEPHVKRIARCLTELAAHPAATSGKVGAVGFSFGGYHLLGQLRQLQAPLGALVIYYATRGIDPSPASPPILAHFAETDEFESEAGRKKMEAALKRNGGLNESFTYPGTHHWFAEADRPEYAPQAARLAFERTVEHLRRALN